MAAEVSQPTNVLTMHAGERVAVTGANGFIGSAVVRALLRRGLKVVAIEQPGASKEALDVPALTQVLTDLGDAEALTRALQGVRVLFHIAPDYRARSKDPRTFQALNVEDTRCVLSVARAMKIEKIVYTSSVGTLGLEGTSFNNPANEDSVPRIDQMVGLYKQSKYVAEHEVLREAAEGLPITLVLPTTSIGPCDFVPTASGRIILDYLRGSRANYFDTALNIVDVDDLAEGYVLAAERGAIGRSYILGGENVEFRQLLGLISQCTGVRTRGYRVPRSIALFSAFISEFIEGRILRKEPSVPLEGVRLATTPLVFSDARARRELGYSSRPAIDAVEHAARWFVNNGDVPPRRARGFIWRDGSSTSESEED